MVIPLISFLRINWCYAIEQSMAPLSALNTRISYVNSSSQAISDREDPTGHHAGGDHL